MYTLNPGKLRFSITTLSPELKIKEGDRISKLESATVKSRTLPIPVSVKNSLYLPAVFIGINSIKTVPTPCVILMLFGRELRISFLMVFAVLLIWFDNSTLLLILL